jgi:hypothetical protein
MTSGNGGSIQDLANPFLLNSLTFNGAAFTVSGVPFRFVADGVTPPTIQQLSTSAQNIYALVQLGTDLTIQANAPATAPLTFSYGITSATSSQGLALNVNANSVNGTVVLACPVTVDGGTTVNSGTLRVTGGGTLGGDFVPVTVNALGAVDSVLEVNNIVNAGSLAGTFAAGRTATVKVNTNARLRLQRSAATTFRGQFQGPGELQTAGVNTLMLQGVTGSLGSIGVTSASSTSLYGGTLTLTRPPSEGATLNVADSGTFSLYDGATLNTTAGTASAAAAAASDRATINIVNAGTTWAANRIVVGNGGSGAAVLSVNNYSAVTVGDSLDVGLGAAHGQFIVATGATVTAANAHLGNSGGFGEARVLDANARWTVTNLLALGSFTGSGSGLLQVFQGGDVNANRTEVYEGSSISIDQGRFTTAQLFGYGPIHLVRDPAGASALNINTPSGASDDGYIGTTDGAGGLTKSGGGTQSFFGRLAHTGPTTVNGGNLIVSGPIDAAGTYTVNSGAALTLSGNTANIGFGQLVANTGGVIEYQDATVNGGFLRGAGAHTVSTGAATFNGSTIFNGATLTASATTNLNNVTSSGQVLNTPTGTLNWSGGFNNGGTLTVNGNANVSAFTSSGVIQVNEGGTLTNADTPLLLGGGSRTSIAKGASLNLKKTTLELSGGLLTNDGTIDGTVNVRFNALATGTGKFGPVFVFDNGRFAPGASASPTVFSTAAVQAAVASFESQAALVVQVAGPKPGDGYDQLAVSDNAALAGRLEVSTSPDYAPTPLASYAVLTFASRTGVFAQYTGLDLPGPLFYAPVYSATDLRLIPTVPGDADINGLVNFDDLLVLAKNYNAVLPTSGPGDNWWTRGDFTLDRIVNFDDLLVLAKNYNGVATATPADLPADVAAAWPAALAAAVPEPTTATTLTLLAASTLLRRNRRTRPTTPGHAN